MLRNKLFLFLIYFVFFLSGVTGLIYQVVWIRQLVIIFGSTTHSVVAVLSAFMGGLALGSFLIGKYTDKSRNLLLLYGCLEFAVGFLSLLTLVTFPIIFKIYQNTSSAFTSLQLILFYKFILASFVILPATTAMGGTLPTLILFLTRSKTKVILASSRLYAINTLGAFAGTLITAYFLIEIFGLSNTLLISVILNCVIGLSIVFLAGSLKKTFKNLNPKVISENRNKSNNVYLTTDKIVLFVYGASGFISLCYEVLWTRLLTPIVGTFIYAFAGVLALFLLGIALGSALYEHLFEKYKNPLLFFSIFELGIGLSAIASILANSNLLNFDYTAKVLLTIVPGTLFMGMTFPAVVAYFSKNKNLGSTIGFAYSVNTVGSIIGSIAAAYFVIPKFGTINGVLILGIGNFILSGLLFLIGSSKYSVKRIFSFGLIIPLTLVTFWLLLLDPIVLTPIKLKTKIQDIRSKGDYNEAFLEDEVASILAYSQKNGADKALYIDGFQTTSLGPDTTLLAHIPLALKPDAKKMLVIAFGMGGTYRSALLHDNLNVDAVELVPSVPKTFWMFFDDSEEVLQNPNGKIIINDGRNYVRTTKEKYDIIVVDPPPPVNASGTTVLYSKEFYEDSKKILNDKGIFVAWFYTGASVDDFKLLFKSFSEVFPHILAINSVVTNGYYLIGSDNSVVFNEDKMRDKFLDQKVYQDNNKFFLDGTININIPPITVESICERIMGDKSVIDKFIGVSEDVSDDHPRTEYFTIRHTLNSTPLMRPEYITKYKDVDYCNQQ